MKQKKLFFVVVVLAFLLSCLTACNDGEDFDFLQLTEANTVSFTVNVTGEWRQLNLVGSGGKMVVEWEEGRVEKIKDPASFGGAVQHTYGNKGTYRVRVWAEELNNLIVGDALLSVSDLRLGNLPKMKHLTLNCLTDTRSLDLNTFCPNVEWINISNCPDLEQVELDRCSRLENIQIYANPKLASLTFGDHPDATSVWGSGNGFTSLSLKGLPALREVVLNGNPELSHLELDEEADGITTLILSECAFQSIDDILSRCPHLTELVCSSNQLTELDLSKHSVTKLVCDHNQLTSLVLPEWCLLKHIYCHSNQLDTEALNALFRSLAQAPEPSSQYPECRIAYNDNPGAEECDEAILLSKGWKTEKKTLLSNEAMH